MKKKKRSVPMSELSEEAQRLKRAAWRAASRRYYARKIARQQAGSAHAGLLPQLRDFRASRVQRRTLTHELPRDCQTLHGQTEAAPGAPPRSDTEWPGDPLGANGGAHAVRGGIECS